MAISTLAKTDLAEHVLAVLIDRVLRDGHGARPLGRGLAGQPGLGREHPEDR